MRHNVVQKLRLIGRLPGATGILGAATSLERRRVESRQDRVSTNVALTLYRIISRRARPTGLIKLIIAYARMHPTEPFRTAADAFRKRAYKIRDYCTDGRFARDKHHREVRLRISDQSCRHSAAN